MIFFNESDPICRLPVFRDCAAFAKRFATEGLTLGRHELQNGIYCGVSEVEPATEDKDFFEAHRKYADLHCILSGKQTMRVGFTDRMRFCEYVEEKDFVKVTGAFHSEVTLTDGSYLFLLPNDAHTVAKAADESFGKSLKIIFKIPLSLLKHEYH